LQLQSKRSVVQIRIRHRSSLSQHRGTFVDHQDAKFSIFVRKEQEASALLLRT
jgi:hypothetical protein